MRQFAFAALAATLFLAAGCSPTYVNFEGPQGSVLTVDSKPYHLPSRVEVWRPAGQGQSNRYNVSAVFPTSQGDLRAAGYLDVYGFAESDMDKLVTNICRFDSDQLANLAKGTTLVYKVQTASRQPLVELTLVKK